ncbi:uncharacterized protein LOC135361351 [Latimeria chalumnae]|uniref:uncharacterized protein LOC135361351 n=1 Tax=Latimeria chalumnae TaxID=7897 RepID=UPI00313CF3C6
MMNMSFTLLFFCVFLGKAKALKCCKCFGITCMEETCTGEQNQCLTESPNGEVIMKRCASTEDCSQTSEGSTRVCCSEDVCNWNSTFPDKCTLDAPQATKPTISDTMSGAQAARDREQLLALLSAVVFLLCFTFVF